MAVTGRPLRWLISLPDASARALRFQVLPQLLGIHVVGALVDVDEFGKRTSLRNRFRGGNECVRDGDDDIAGLTPAAISAKRRASVPLFTATACFGFAEGGKGLLEILDHRAADEARGAQRLLKHRR